MTLLAIIFLPVLAAWVPLLSDRLGRNSCTSLTLVVPLIVVGLILGHLPLVLQGKLTTVSFDWIPSFGLNLAFRIDALSLMFALLISGIGVLVIWYARFYLAKEDSLSKLYSMLLMFMTAMLGIVLSDNILLLVVFWELTSLTSFLLIGYWQKNSDARKGARLALAVTGGGGLALMAGVILIGQVVGSFNLGDVLASHSLITEHSLYPVILVLVLLGVFTKSAQFPFHFWLPHAMAAPTPVSAYLHSATMVKAGVFLLARLFPALGGTDLWIILVTLTGLTTMTFAAAMAMFKHDLKGLLAYSTVSHLGLITMLFGIGTELAVLAAVFHIMNHAAFKASLFMVSGAVDHGTGTRNLRVLRGMYKFMPLTAVLSVLGAAAMAGVPFFNGFLSKEMMLTASIGVNAFGSFAWLIPVVATIAATFSVFYSLRFAHNTFFGGKAKKTPVFPPHAPSKLMMAPVMLLVAICVAVGLFAQPLVGNYINLAAATVLGFKQSPYTFHIWHGISAPLLMSALALGGGVVVYQFRAKLFAWYNNKPDFNELYIFEGIIKWVASWSNRFTNTLENGSLQRYIAFIILLFVLMLAFALVPLKQLSGDIAMTKPDLIASVSSFILVFAAFTTVLIHHNRFVALLMLSVVGLMVAILFARFSAPDLALTQLSVEAATIILLILALFFIPKAHINESRPRRVARDITIATLAAIGVGILVYAVLTRPMETISDYYLENAKSLGGGYNVVNVILVDFRGFDTFGEITVLAIAGLGIANMLKNLYLPLPITDNDGRAWSTDPHPILVSMMARILLPLALMVSVYIFLRGHNAPGGGFIAGLVTSVALILQYMASGVGFVHARMHFNYTRWLAGGVLVAGVTGMGSWLVGYPFLTSTFQYITWPIVGTFEVSSALPFDVGVYLTVVATTLLILAYIGKLTTTERVDG
ncbi:MAG: monovalent cation/H+ antiporter subunit A [Thiohalomonadaceae bacterium]